MGLRSLIKKYKKLKANPFSGNIKDRLDKGKDFMSEAQQGSVLSKYAGVRAFPGMVKSEAERQEDAEAAGAFAEQQIAATAETQRQEARTRSSMPSKAEQDLIAKRRLAASKRRGGRASTILSDETLG